MNDVIIKRFERLSSGQTRVHVKMAYQPPAGVLGHAVAALLGSDPKRKIDGDLLRMKSLIETGKTTASGEEITQEQLAA